MYFCTYAFVCICTMFPKFLKFLNANVICQVNPSDKSQQCLRLFFLNHPRPLSPPLSYPSRITLCRLSKNIFILEVIFNK